MIKTLKYHLVALVLLQIALCFLYGYHKVYNNRPFSIHQWRQTDCASFTKNYYEEGMHFFKPEIHWQGTIEGKTVSEFPLINYSVAFLWKVFGEHEYLYRFTVLSIYIISLLFLFVMIFQTSGSLVYSYFATTLITTSPLLAYYSFSFLADIPALSFAIISLSLFFTFLHNRKKSLFLFSVFFATLATLLKASSITVLSIIVIISLLKFTNFSKIKTDSKNLFNSILFPFISILISAILILSWYYFAYCYNNKNSDGVFLMGTLPIWQLDKEKITLIARLLYSVQLEVYFNRGVLIMMFIGATWLFMNLKLITSHLKIALILSAISFFAFIILFYQVFNVHDYYLINTMIFPIVILTAFGEYLKNINFNFRNKKIIAICFILFGLNATYCASVVRMRNIENDKFCKYYPFITNEEKNFSDWIHYNYKLTLKPLETITPYLRSLGIKRTDKVISAPDPSFNITLYLMDQKGFTATEESLQKDSTKINEYIYLGAKYVILNDTNILRTTSLVNIKMSVIGRYNNIFIYKLN